MSIPEISAKTLKALSEITKCVLKIECSLEELDLQSKEEAKTILQFYDRDGRNHVAREKMFELLFKNIFLETGCDGDKIYEKVLFIFKFTHDNAKKYYKDRQFFSSNPTGALTNLRNNLTTMITDYKNKYQKKRIGFINYILKQMEDKDALDHLVQTLNFLTAGRIFFTVIINVF
jgi:hypothetical protein